MGRKIETLLKKPIWQMTGEEFLLLSGKGVDGDQNSNSVKFAYGMRNLGDAIGCSLTRVFDLKKNGILDDAIVSFIGKKIVFDVEKARMLANQYMEQQKTLKQQEELNFTN